MAVRRILEQRTLESNNRSDAMNVDVLNETEDIMEALNDTDTLTTTSESSWMQDTFDIATQEIFRVVTALVGLVLIVVLLHFIYHKWCKSARRKYTEDEEAQLKVTAGRKSSLRGFMSRMSTRKSRDIYIKEEYLTPATCDKDHCNFKFLIIDSSRQPAVPTVVSQPSDVLLCLQKQVSPQCPQCYTNFMMALDKYYLPSKTDSTKVLRSCSCSSSASAGQSSISSTATSCSRQPLINE